MKSLSLAQHTLPVLLVSTVLAACGGSGGQPATTTSVSTGSAGNTTVPAPQPERLAASIQICAGQSADPGGQVSASSAIQSCIDQIGAGGTLELPAGTYLMTSQLKLAFPFTLRTQGLLDSTQTCTDGANCATLKAAPSFADRYGILMLGGPGAVERIVLDHVAVDGNRSARLSGPAYDACKKGSDNTYGFNVTVQNCSNCKVTYSASSNALCGTGMQWAGNGATIEHNIFARNGDHDAVPMWADGLTLHDSDDSSIQDNRMTDNSDVGLISFGSARTKIIGNVITQSGEGAFAALMLDSLRTGDYTGSRIAGNSVTCAPGKCFFAVNIGPDAWYPENRPVFGGRFEDNTISGGTIGLNIGGTSNTAQLMYVGGNNIFGSFSGARAACLYKGSPAQTAFSRDPYSPVWLGDNFLNNVLVNPLLQSVDHCIA